MKKSERLGLPKLEQMDKVNFVYLKHKLQVKKLSDMGYSYREIADAYGVKHCEIRNAIKDIKVHN